MQIDLSKEEVEALNKLIEREVAELSPEIHHTGTATLRDELKAYRCTLRALHDRMRDALAA